MGILADRPQTLTSFRAARAQLLSYLIGSVVLLSAILVVPKDPSWGSLRLGLALGLFGAVALLLWIPVDPLPEFLRRWLDLSLEDMGDEHHHLGDAAVSSLGRWAGMIATPLLIADGFAALWVTAAWPFGAPLRPISWLLHLGMWAGCLAFPYLLLKTTQRLTETIVIWRSFNRQIGQSGYRTITIAEAARQEAQLSGPAAVVTGPYRFSAGGFEWSWSDFQKNSIVFGQPGSGKTITVLNSLLEGLLSSADGANGTEPAAALILDPKGGYRDKIERLCARIGRSQDLIILDPDNPAVSKRWNPLDNTEAAIDVSGRFAMVMKLLGMESGADSFWIDSAKVFLEHAISLLRATLPASAAPSFALVNSLATQPLAVEARLFFMFASRLLEGETTAFVTVSDLASDVDPADLLASIAETDPAADGLLTFFQRWAGKTQVQRSAIHRALVSSAAEMAYDPDTTLTPGSSALVGADHLMNIWLTMPEKTRTSVMPHLNNMLNPFLSEPYRSAFSGRSEFYLGEALDTGKLIYVAMPAEKRSTMSRTINTLIKIEYQREVLLRLNKSRFSLFFCDEFQNFVTIARDAGDAAFFSKSRESRHANVVATQNVSGLLLQVDKPEMAESLLGNCAVKIFLRNDDKKTLEFASEAVFGSYTATISTVGRSGSAQGGRLGFSESISLNESVQTLPRVSPQRLRRLTIADLEAGNTHSEAFVNVGSRSANNIERLLFQVNPL